MKIKILQLITLAETGGAQRIVEGLVRGLIKDGRFDVTLACGPGEDLVAWLSDCLTEDHVVRLKHLRRPIRPFGDVNALRLLRVCVGDRFSFDFVGDGPLLRETSKAVRVSGLVSQVRFLGNRSDVVDQLFKHDIFVLSSWEGLPVSAVEPWRRAFRWLRRTSGGP